jgi:hypothetical protein
MQTCTDGDSSQTSVQIIRRGLWGWALPWRHKGRWPHSTKDECATPKQAGRGTTHNSIVTCCENRINHPNSPPKWPLSLHQVQFTKSMVLLLNVAWENVYAVRPQNLSQASFKVMYRKMFRRNSTKIINMMCDKPPGSQQTVFLSICGVVFCTKVFLQICILKFQTHVFIILLGNF